MLPFKRLSWLWIVFQIVVVVNVNPLVSRRGEYKEYILPLYFCRRIFSARVFQRIMFQRPPFLHCILQPYLSNREYHRKVLEKSLSGKYPLNITKSHSKDSHSLKMTRKRCLHRCNSLLKLSCIWPVLFFLAYLIDWPSPQRRTVSDFASIWPTTKLTRLSRQATLVCKLLLFFFDFILHVLWQLKLSNE